MPHATAATALSRDALLRIASPLRESIAAAPYEPPAGSSASVKSLLAALLPSPSQPQPPAGKEAADLLFCAVVLAASPESPALHWVPAGLSGAAAAATEEMAAAGGWDGVGEMVRAMMAKVVPPLKAVVKESCVDADNDEIGAAKPPKEHAIVAAHQFRWLVTQVNYPKLGELCWLIIPCALTTLDHWSPEVKEQGMVSFMHIARNVKVTELNLYEDAILDACCHNVAADDELWYRVVEVSVLLLTCTQRSNPRSPWHDRILSEMLGHLERQPLNRERCLAWLTLIGQFWSKSMPLSNSPGSGNHLLLLGWWMSLSFYTKSQQLGAAAKPCGIVSWKCLYCFRNARGSSLREHGRSLNVTLT